ncbi:MAG: glycosyltransferase family 39 protein [Acidimicrobiales bacterium]
MDEDAPETSLSRTDLLAALALSAVSAAACLVDLGSRSLWNDELHSALIAVHHGTSLWAAVTVDGGNMVLYYLVLHVFVAIFGSSQFALRLPSALAGASLTPVVFFLSRRMFGSRTAIIAAAIVAVSPPLVIWDQQARGYCLGTLLIASSLLAFFRALERPTTLRWCVYGLLAVLSVYTLVYAALFLVAQLLPLCFWPAARRQARAMSAVVGVVVLAYVPLVVAMLRGTAADVLGGNGPPTAAGTLQFFQELASGRAPELAPVTLLVSIVTVIGLLCWVLAGTELVSRIRRGSGEFETFCLGVALCWLLLPLPLDAIFSVTYRSLFEPAYLLQCVPAGAMVVAFVIAKLLPKLASSAVAVALVALLVAALVPTYGVSYEEWATVTRYIRTAYGLGDCLGANKAESASNLAYYFDSAIGPTPRLVIPAMTWSESLDPARPPAAASSRVATAASTCRRVWFVINRETTSQFFIVDGDIAWFRRHGLTHLTASHFQSSYGNDINVLLLSR